MGYTSPSQYVLQNLCNAAQTPLASTTYYMGSIGNMSASEANKRFYITVPGVITKAVVLLTFTIGTSEATSLYIRKNATTDYAISTTLDFSSMPQQVTTSLNIPLIAGDYFDFKLVTPNWVTAPTNVYFCIYVVIQSG